ncbi:unnamed protein product [Mesocestoides corti]|uniref:alpha-mannosidase n=1 Tax=Mesocestoides corti TaxID=53468 RepID=A0A3P6I3N5_MESCO|nr:unnamed protein product [Mesocestoides corti]
MDMWSIVVFYAIFLLHSTVAEECGYSLCPSTKDDYINVHIIPHTHDDVGWLKNIDQYYFGDATWYQTAGVQYILDSVMQALSINPERKFTYVEMAFFERWWRMQNSAMRELVHQLVRNGQLEFALGGWTMNDEAVVHYGDSIDQLTRGLAFLNATFGECGRPRVAWQIDPFGHAREQARVFLDAGFDGVFFQRMDFREKRTRLKNREMEVLWRADPSDNTTGLFTHMLYQSYCSPPGFCFDSKCNDPPMVVDPLATNYNVPSRVAQFLEYARSVARSYATNHIFVPMGCDFTFENANENFVNLDRLIEHVNAQQRSTDMPVRLLYSSPTCYTKAVNDAFNKRGTIPDRQGDFFPYASASNTYWTGYFTSRPAQKYMVRQASGLLSACEQVINPDDVVDHLRRMMGVMQHHDAITGTEKQHVSDDYRLRLFSAMRGCQNLVASVADTLFDRTATFQTCDALNVSVCSPATRKDDLPDAIVAVYTPLAWDDFQPWMRLPLHATKEQADAQFRPADRVTDVYASLPNHRWSRKFYLPVSEVHPIEASYYPVVNRIMLKGTEYAFAVYTDRSEGGSSLAEGEVELMLHRATVSDDGLGVGEPLTERVFGQGLAVKGVHRLLLDTLPNVERLDPRMAQEVSRPPTFLFRNRANETFDANKKVSLLHKALPHGLHLLTAQQWKQFLVRLQHIAIPGDGPIEFDLKDAFTVGRVVEATELSLTANQLASAARANSKRRFEASLNGTLLKIQPGEIKTLLLKLE